MELITTMCSITLNTTLIIINLRYIPPTP